MRFCKHLASPINANNGNEVSFKALLHHLQQFGCYASRLIPQPQHHGSFSPRSKPCVRVGSEHDSPTLWRIWDPAFRVVSAQSDVISDELTNVYPLFLDADQTGIFQLLKETKCIKEIEKGRDGHLFDHAGTSRTGEGHGNGDHDCTKGD
jgi:hypothetical protein